MKVAIAFGTTGGATEEVVDKIKDLLGVDADVLDVSDASATDLAGYDVILAGIPTYEEGELQEDWGDFVDDLKEVDLAGKKVALFGLGDQEEYAEYFLSGMGKLYKVFEGCGATMGAGFWATDGYEFDASEAVMDGKFCGLGIDEDNQSDLTDDRVTAWVTQIKGELGL